MTGSLRSDFELSRYFLVRRCLTSQPFRFQPFAVRMKRLLSAFVLGQRYFGIRLLECLSSLELGRGRPFIWWNFSFPPPFVSSFQRANLIPKFVRFGGLSSFRPNLVSALSDYQPTGSDHVLRGMRATNGITTARMIEPVTSGDEVAVYLSLTQRSAHCRRRRFHHPLSLGA